MNNIPPTITERHTTALRSFIVEGPESWQARYEEDLAGESGAGFSLLLYLTLATALRRKFAPEYSTGQVVRYVADLRVSLEGNAQTLDPRLTEIVIRAALGDESIEDFPPYMVDSSTIIRTELLLLVALIAEERLDDEQLDKLIIESAGSAGKIDYLPFPRT
ncbi:hypothetical protein [Actinomadura madurae]|uniref:hypothetical protein n=1 Tax=Actinomadura madurae TaxID=1993 RepID=UPI0011BD75AD|nr:hypothetical protein [Actinomadura madurae]